MKMTIMMIKLFSVWSLVVYQSWPHNGEDDQNEEDNNNDEIILSVISGSLSIPTQKGEHDQNDDENNDDKIILSMIRGSLSILGGDDQDDDGKVIMVMVKWFSVWSGSLSILPPQFIMPPTKQGNQGTFLLKETKREQRIEIAYSLESFHRPFTNYIVI